MIDKWHNGYLSLTVSATTVTNQHTIAYNTFNKNSINALY